MTSFSTPKPLVSVQVITYNHGPYIAQCLESIAGQDADFPFEILVGEDCSTDDTRATLLDLAAKYPDRIRPILNPANLGAHNNSDNLRRLANGRYLAICEGDDYWHRKDKLKRQVSILESDPSVALVCTDADAFFQATGRRICSIHERSGQWNRQSGDITLDLLTRRINIFTPSVCMPRDLLHQVQAENPDMFSWNYPMRDLQTWLELSCRGRVVPIRESFVTYRVLRESASRSADPQKMFDFSTAALNVSEHYVRRFGYSPDVMHRVRMTQIWGMIALVAKHRHDHLRQKLVELLRSRSIVGRTPAQILAFWMIENRISFSIGAPLAPFLLRLQRISTRLRALATYQSRIANYRRHLNSI